VIACYLAKIILLVTWTQVSWKEFDESTTSMNVIKGLKVKIGDMAIPGSSSLIDL
jgi:hypothetical protein